MILDSIKRVTFESYKGFKNSKLLYSIDFGSAFNLIIGKNNSGKSSLIDIIQALIQISVLNEKDSVNEIYKGIEDLGVSFIIDEKHINGIFKTEESMGYTSNYKYASQYLGDEIKIRMTPKGHDLIGVISKGRLISDFNYIQLKNKWISLADKYFNEIKQVRFRRIDAERDIVPEYESDSDEVNANGEGLTNLVRQYINKENLDESIVEETLLKELNNIIGEDANYTGIRVQQNEKKEANGYKWEIYLEENGKRYALSKSGSGLKTILLVLVNLYLIPKITPYVGKEIVYAFEELENNLHPALQRRLYDYLYNYSINNPVIIFLTSHSATAINTFFGKKDTRIYHVSKQEDRSYYSEMKYGEQAQNLLDDLGIKASDLLQSNGIIWVEGPSDRIYINRWLEVFCNNAFVEGRDYQYMYYGGRLLSHYTISQDDTRTDELINMMKINRHSAIVIDSDKKSRNAQINKTKQRIRNEIERSNGLCWITKGKEIENYLPAEAINNLFGTKLDQIDQYELFPDYIKKYKDNFSSVKVGFARDICPFISEENSQNILDLKQQITKLHGVISGWCSNSTSIH